MQKDTSDKIIDEKELLIKGKKRALRLLERKDYSRKELVDKLYKDGYSDELVEKIIEYVDSYHYLDDTRVAGSYIRGRMGYKSKRELEYMLKQKGISEEEISIMRRKPSTTIIDELEAVVTKEEYEELTAMVSEVTISDDVANYIMDIVEYTRNDKSISVGVSPRGTLALFKAAQITAAMEGRDYVIPEDVQREAVAVLSHRISAGVGSRLDCEKYIERIIEEVQVPIEEV